MTDSAMKTEARNIYLSERLRAAAEQASRWRFVVKVSLSENSSAPFRFECYTSWKQSDGSWTNLENAASLLARSKANAKEGSTYSDKEHWDLRAKIISFTEYLRKHKFRPEPQNWDLEGSFCLSERGYLSLVSRRRKSLEKKGIHFEQAPELLLLKKARVRLRCRVRFADSSGVLGANSLMASYPELVVDGQIITLQRAKEILKNVGTTALLGQSLVKFKCEELEAAVRRLESLNHGDGECSLLTFGGLLQWASGGGCDATMALPAVNDESAEVVLDPGNADCLRGLLNPELISPLDVSGFVGEIKPYQMIGAAWLCHVVNSGFGACLADDMGLGKTIQAIVAILVLKKKEEYREPVLVVCPTSMVSTWQDELARFAPGLRAKSIENGASFVDDGVDVVVASYGIVSRDGDFSNRNWSVVVLDEAQNIKNPDAIRTETLKKINSRARIALTATPVENKAGDLLSLMQFLNPPIFGAVPHSRAAVVPPERLAMACGPFLLRRMKTDSHVGLNIPPKINLSVSCALTELQADHYRHEVEALREKLRSAKGLERLTAVSTSLRRIQQICNFIRTDVGDSLTEYSSGKLLETLKIAREAHARDEKMIIFTAFRESASMVRQSLEMEFGPSVLHFDGGVAGNKRHELIKKFQTDPGYKFFVLTVRAGGQGITLTKAEHVVHFDRWWNPAVEAQATDRAHRIGQKNQVHVHTLMCKGTIEERVAELLESKRALAERLLSGKAQALTSMSDEEIEAILMLRK